MTENQEQKPQETPLPQNDTGSGGTSNPQSGSIEVESDATVEKHVEVENRVNDFLRAISEETSQLTEFLAQEKKLTNEICSLLAQTLKNLKISFNIPSTYISKLEARQIKLSKEGYLVIKGDGNKVYSKPLEEHPPDIILKVMLVIVPELGKAVKAYRRSICQRVSLLEKIKHELGNLQKAFSPEENESIEQLHQEEIKNPQVTTQGQG